MKTSGEQSAAESGEIKRPKSCANNLAWFWVTLTFDATHFLNMCGWMKLPARGQKTVCSSARTAAGVLISVVVARMHAYAAVRQDVHLILSTWSTKHLCWFALHQLTLLSLLVAAMVAIWCNIAAAHLSAAPCCLLLRTPLINPLINHSTDKPFHSTDKPFYLLQAWQDSNSSKQVSALIEFQPLVTGASHMNTSHSHDICPCSYCGDVFLDGIMFAKRLSWLLLQIARCQGSDCDFFVSPEGVLSRSSSCNAPACVGHLNFTKQGISKIDPAAFSNMSAVTVL